MNDRFNSIHVFAGAGGGILADILLGHRPVAAVEIEPYCQRVLMARQRDGHIPWFPIYNDIREFDGRPYRGVVDIVAGGFPCTNISVARTAGASGGIDGDKSGLWQHMFRVVCDVHPRFVFVENSPAITSRGIGRVLGDLASVGYDATWDVLGGCCVRAPHDRLRWWCLAGRDLSRPVDPSVSRQMAHSGQKRLGEGEAKPEWVRRQSDSYGSVGSACRHVGYSPSPWHIEPPRPDVDWVDDGLADRVGQLAALGNGQVPAVAALAWRLLYNRLMGA